MAPRTLLPLWLGWLAACGGEPPGAPQADPAPALPTLYEADIGTVSFPVSCEPRAAHLVERGVVLLHHMMYDEARLGFATAEALDPSCAMALWGQAMTQIHPLWPDRPAEAILQWGAEVAQRATLLGADSPRERDYLGTASAYFVPQPGDSESARLERFERAWRTVAERHPDDLDAQAFHALSLIAVADPRDKSFARQRQAGDIARRVLQQVPEHPGAHHYLIHAYDNPLLAPQARAVADRYGALTPAVPHATHMMTHIYTRLGAWQQSIEWNQRAADAAWALCVESGEITSHYQHALDYLAYAHLQLGADSAARSVVESAANLQAPFGAMNPSAAAYAFAALPARYHLERRDWRGAAALTPRTPAGFPWTDEHRPYVAITHFARGLARARLGQAEAARQEVTALHGLRDALAADSAYWAEQIDIQALVVEAWVQYLSEDAASGVASMRRAAALEAGTEKSPVTPGEVLPAAELLGDMLLDAGDAAGALAAYRQSLERTPGRLNSLYGAALAAERAGRLEDAGTYFAQVAAALAERGERAEMRRMAGGFVERAGTG